jgi:hypothetical protein
MDEYITQKAARSRAEKRCDNKAIVSPSTAKLKCPLRKGGGHEGDNYIEYGSDLPPKYRPGDMLEFGLDERRRIWQGNDTHRSRL